jgi:hypothetical protein
LVHLLVEFVKLLSLELSIISSLNSSRLSADFATVSQSVFARFLKLFNLLFVIGKTMVPSLAELFFLFLKSFHGLIDFIKLLLLFKRLSHEFVVVRSKLVESIVVLAIIVMVLTGVILHFSLDFGVSSRGHFGEVHFSTLTTLDFLGMTLECLISVPKESDLIIAVSNGIVKAVQADGVADLLEFVLTVVAGIDVLSLSLDLSVLVLSVTVRSLDVAELLLVSGVDIRLFVNSVRERDGIIVSVLDGLLGLSIVVVDLVLEVDEDIQSVLVVSDLEVQLVSVVSPGNSVFITADLKLLLPGSQQLKESHPVRVSGHGNELLELIHDIFVNSEVGGDLLVDVLEVLSLSVAAISEVPALSSSILNGVLVVGIGLSIVVDITLRDNPLVLTDFLV